MKKRIVSVLLTAVMMVGLLAGCGNAGSDGQGGQHNQDVDDGRVFDGTINLPLTEEKVTLKMWIASDSTFFQILQDYNDSEFFKEMERRTNVHIEFDVPSDMNQAYGLMISAGADNMPDIICYPTLYPDGMDAAIDDGYYLDVSQYFDTYLYNYNQVRKSDPKFLRESVTDTGRAAYINTLQTSVQGPWVGMQIRQDWLDELGLPTPVTYDDLENVLTQFKDKKGCYAPLAFSSTLTFLFGELSAGYGVKNDFLNKDGTVVAGFATEEWRAYLTRMHDWFEKGLIDPDFTTHSAVFVDMNLPTTQTSGVWYGIYTWAGMFEGALMGAGVQAPEVKALASPKLNADDTLHIRCQDQYIQATGAAISAKSKYKEIAMQWIDYLFTKEGADLANYGVEGQSFNYGAGGKPEFTDLIANHTEYPDGTSQQSMLKWALVPSNIPSYYDWTRELITVPLKDQASFTIWANDKYLDDWVMPPISMTAEESQERAGMYTDIQSYVSEASTKFITGEMDVTGEDWDNYISTIKRMGLDRCVEITQDALDRYLAR